VKGHLVWLGVTEYAGLTDQLTFANPSAVLAFGDIIAGIQGGSKVTMASTEAMPGAPAVRRSRHPLQGKQWQDSRALGL
jgi:hypothetical protein